MKGDQIKKNTKVLNQELKWLLKTLVDLERFTSISSLQAKYGCWHYNNFLNTELIKRKS